MFPLRDSHQTRSFPFVNYAIIGATIVIFLIQLSSADFNNLVYQFGFIPHLFDPLNPATYFYAFSSMWLHGGLFHIASNLWFLHIFGDNVEDTLGHVKYLAFYIVAGLFAVLTQYMLNTTSVVPLIGASGAISGVAGAYFVLFSKSRIEAIVPTLVGFWDIVELPSWFFLGYWFFIQLFSGVGSLVTMGQAEGGGVAFFAHIGGFVFGFLTAFVFGRKRDV